MLSDKAKEFLKDWYNGLFIISIALWSFVFYYTNPQFQPSIQKALPYDTVFNFVIILMICNAIYSLSTGIAKLIMKNRRIVAWIIRQKEKQEMRKWRNNKSGV